MNSRQRLWATSRALGWEMDKKANYSRGNARIEVQYTPTGMVHAAELYIDDTLTEYVPAERLPGKLDAVLEWMKHSTEVTQ